MNEKLKKLYDERLKLDTDQKAIIEKAQKENRGFTADEQTQYDKMDADYQKVTDEIKSIEKMAALGDKHDKRAAAHKELQTEGIRPDPEKKEVKKEERKGMMGIEEFRKTEPYNRVFKDFLVGNIDHKEARSMMWPDVEVRRTLQADKEVVGGFLVVPETFMTDLIQDLKNAVFFRGLSRNINMPKADKIAWPVLDATVDDSNWTSELKTGAEDASMAFEKYTLSPHPSAKRVRISSDLIRKAAIDVEAVVRTELAFKFGVTEEKAFLQGTGTNQPLGVFTSSAAGISTGRDVSTGNTTTEIKADNLIECKYNLKAQWRGGCSWLFHRDAIKAIRKLKTGDGAYLWKPGISSDKPDTILEYPVYESEYVPNTFTTGLYVGILGNFNYYIICTALDMRVAVLTELYAETNEIGYIGRMEVDGAPIREQAFVRVKLA